MAEKKKREKWGVSRQISLPTAVDVWLVHDANREHRTMSGHIAFRLEQIHKHLEAGGELLGQEEVGRAAQPRRRK